MTTNFDPTKHRFGMAYKYKANEPPEALAYPINWDREYVYCYNPQYYQGYKKYVKLFDTNLTRAPEHDYLPRADVMELVESAEAVLNRWEQPNWKDVAPTAVVMNSMRNTLTNFKQKYGEF